MHKSNYKKKIIFLSISLFITVLILGAGITYAYFAMTLRNVESSSTIYVKSGSINVSFESGENNINAENITPGWMGYKYFSVTSTNKTSKTYTYNINLFVDYNNFETDLSNDSPLSWMLYQCTSQGTDCDTTTPLAFSYVNQSSGEVNLYTETVSKATAGTKYYALKLIYPNKVDTVQSQYGTDGELHGFAGHITITSDDKLSQ